MVPARTRSVCGSKPRTAALAALMLALPAAAPASGLKHAQPISATVVMKNFGFAPMTLRVPAGTTVTWINRDGEPHTVTSLAGTFRSGALDQSESFKFRFDKPGTYNYVCSIHPRMTAAIIVK